MGSLLKVENIRYGFPPTEQALSPIRHHKDVSATTAPLGIACHPDLYCGSQASQLRIYSLTIITIKIYAYLNICSMPSASMLLLTILIIFFRAFLTSFIT